MKYGVDVKNGTGKCASRLVVDDGVCNSSDANAVMYPDLCGSVGWRDVKVQVSVSSDLGP